jgi:AcrR family transcriptional regulator
MQDESERVPNAKRTASTRAQLIAAARGLFVEKGYGETGTPEIAARAGLTRGALYHHFTDKRRLFAAVVEAENAAVAAAIEAAAPQAGPGALAALRGGAAAYLSAMLVPGRGALLLVEGPAVLGAEAAWVSDARHGLRSLREGLAEAMAEGEIAPLPLDALSEVLGAAFDGAALAILRGRPAPEAAAAVLALINGMARVPSGA